MKKNELGNKVLTVILAGIFMIILLPIKFLKLVFFILKELLKLIFLTFKALFDKFTVFMRRKNLGKKLFRIESTEPRKKMFGGLFKHKQPNFTIYEHGFTYEDLEDIFIYDFFCKDIFGVYRNDNLFNEKGYSSIIMNCKRDNDYQQWYFDEDSSFPNLIEKIEDLYENEWKSYAKNYPDTIKWFLGVSATWNILNERMYNVFGRLNNDFDLRTETHTILYETWGLENATEYRKLCEDAYNDELLKDKFLKDKYEDFLQNEDFLDNMRIITVDSGDITSRKFDLMKNFPKCMYAYNLFTIITIANLGCVVDIFTEEEALDLCLKAGEKMQKLFTSWEDYNNNLELGYSFAMDENIMQDLKIIYEKMKIHKRNPWDINWNTKLKKTW